MKLKTTLSVLMLILVLVVTGCTSSNDTHSEGDNMVTEETVGVSDMDETDVSENSMVEENMTDETADEASMSESTEATDDSELPEMTLDELSKFNGKDGQPVYVAVDGIVYDFTHLDKWKTGQHMGQHDAGQDLSDAILKSPHGKKILERAIPVATLVE
jgi:predicted heme/steroid binding protein